MTNQEVDSDEVTQALIRMMDMSKEMDYSSVMQAGIMFIVAMCMQGGADPEDIDTAAAALLDQFKSHWKIAFSVRAQYVGPVGHA